jgi:hypothetical protein
MTNPNHIETANILPRGLRREQAAFYLGISPSKFDLERKSGKIPSPKNFAGVALYCRHELDAMFDELTPLVAANDNNEWDSVLLGKRTLQ